MERSALIVFFFILLLQGAAGSVSADPLNVTTEATTAVVTATEPGRTGGSVYFETYPSGATIWVDGREIGTSDLTYFFEKPGTYTVRAWKKGFGEYTGEVTVSEGRKVVFEAVLTAITPAPFTTAPAVTTKAVTATTTWRSTLALPTPWPTATQSAPDPCIVPGAVALGLVILVARRR